MCTVGSVLLRVDSVCGCQMRANQGGSNSVGVKPNTPLNGGGLLRSRCGVSVVDSGQYECGCRVRMLKPDSASTTGVRVAERAQNV